MFHHQCNNNNNNNTRNRELRAAPIPLRIQSYDDWQVRSASDLGKCCCNKLSCWRVLRKQKLRIVLDTQKLKEWRSGLFQCFPRILGKIVTSFHMKSWTCCLETWLSRTKKWYKQSPSFQLGSSLVKLCQPTSCLLIGGSHIQKESDFGSPYLVIPLFGINVLNFLVFICNWFNEIPREQLFFATLGKADDLHSNDLKKKNWRSCAVKSLEWNWNCPSRGAWVPAFDCTSWTGPFCSSAGSHGSGGR